MPNASHPNWLGKRVTADSKPSTTRHGLRVKRTSRFKKMWFGLLTLLMGCAATSPPSVSEPSRVPTLPTEARVSRVMTPSVCLPGCMKGQIQRREWSRSTLIGSESQDLPVNPLLTK